MNAATLSPPAPPLADEPDTPPQRLKLGAIALDWPSARDLCNNLVAAGMCVTWTHELPRQPLWADDDAVVVLIQPHAQPADAAARALRAALWLRAQGAQQLLWVLPTFPHVTETGQPRPAPLRVLRALLHALGQDFTAVIPSDPEQGVRLLKGHLFKGDLLLDEALSAAPTPAASQLLPVLRQQLDMPVELVNLETVQAGTVPLQTRLAEMRLKGPVVALLDASDDTDLSFIAQSVRERPLLAGSAAMGIALPQNFGIAPNLACSRLPPPQGHRAVVCGTGAQATAQQIRHLHAAGHAVMAIDPLKVAKHGAERVAQAALAWAAPQLAQRITLFYSTLNATTREAASSLLGATNAAVLVSDCLALIAQGLLAAGVRQLILSGNGTGHRCLRQLGLRQMIVGDQMDGGAPWCFAPLPAQTAAASGSDDGVHLLVKAGTAGDTDFFLRAFEGLRQPG